MVFINLGFQTPQRRAAGIWTSRDPDQYFPSSVVSFTGNWNQFSSSPPRIGY